MLAQAALEAMFDTDEDERLERKESTKDRDKLCQAICAFANDLGVTGKPGVLLIGQRDDRSCAGLRVDEQLLEIIGGWRSDGKLQPMPTMTVHHREVRGCSLAVVSVAPSDNTPVRYDGRVWIRVGPRRAVASAEEERRLTEKRRSSDLPFDARGLRGTSIADLDMARFKLEYLPNAVPRDVLAQNQRTDEQQLRALRLLDANGLATATAILVIGKQPQSLFAGAYVQALRIDGERLTQPIVDQHQITGTIGDQLRRLDELGDLWNERASIVGGERRQDVDAYPPEALRQVFRNAVLHRTYEGTNSPVRLTWYNDRIEISSPGGLYGHVTPESFGKPGVTDYRNPTLAESLRNLGFVEKFGVGLQIVADSLQRNGNPPFWVQVEPNFVNITIGRKA